MAAPQTGAHRAALRRRRAAQDKSAFRLVVADPVDLGVAADGGSLDAFPQLANARLGISFSATMLQAQANITIHGSKTRTLKLPASLAADVVFDLQNIERGFSVVINNVTAPPCDVTLYVLDEWTRPTEIAFGEFT